jgi:hypothetical protein
VVRHLVAASAAVVLLASGCSDEGSESTDGADVTAADDAAAEDSVPRLSIDLDQLIAQLEDGEVEVPPDFEPPTPNQIDQPCLGGVLEHLVNVGALREGDLMLWYLGANNDDSGPVVDAVNAIFAEGDCLKS